MAAAIDHSEKYEAGQVKDWPAAFIKTERTQIMVWVLLILIIVITLLALCAIAFGLAGV